MFDLRSLKSYRLVLKMLLVFLKLRLYRIVKLF